MNSWSRSFGLKKSDSVYLWSDDFPQPPKRWLGEDFQMVKLWGFTLSIEIFIKTNIIVLFSQKILKNWEKINCFSESEQNKCPCEDGKSISHL